MNATEYDNWYKTPKGRWIGKREVETILAALRPQPGESLLDVGCGTGFFTRELTAATTGMAAGVDLNPEWVAYARHRDNGRASYQVADARALPYPNRSFDLVISITALCFIQEEAAALREIVRVTRRRFAIGLLNRHSLLWLRKGTRGGSGNYRDARWHTPREATALFRHLPVRDLEVYSAIQAPDGGRLAQLAEKWWPPALTTGAFLLVTGEKEDYQNTRFMSARMTTSV